jgi:hypothetical protein
MSAWSSDFLFPPTLPSPTELRCSLLWLPTSRPLPSPKRTFRYLFPHSRPHSAQSIDKKSIPGSRRKFGLQIESISPSVDWLMMNWQCTIKEASSPFASYGAAVYMRNTFRRNVEVNLSSKEWWPTNPNIQPSFYLMKTSSWMIRMLSNLVAVHIAVSGIRLALGLRLNFSSREGEW